MSYVAEESYDVYDERWITARKPHTCCACKETIPAGGVYAKISIVFDRGAESIKRCARCQKIHLHLRGKGDKWTQLWPDERLDCGEEYREHWGEDPPEEIAALAFALPGEVK